MSGDIDAVIAGLTDAQRRCAAGEHAYFSRRTHQALLNKGILESVGGFLVRTPLGLALRARLQEPRA